jgi:hypothetical protein
MKTYIVLMALIEHKIPPDYWIEDMGLIENNNKKEGTKVIQ